MAKLPSNYLQLSLAMQALAGVCDLATNRDSDGFNGGDANFGHILAEAAVERWSPRMADAAYRMAVRYQGQLSRRFGIEVGEIKRPTERDMRNGAKPRVTSFDAKVAGDLVVLNSSAFPGRAAVNAVKACPGRTFSKKPAPAWRVPLSAAPQLLKMQTDGHMRASAAVIERLRQAIADRVTAVEASTAVEADITVQGIGGTLRPFQRAGVAYASKHLRCWIADEMGLGKTVQALATLQSTESYPAVIVVPANLKLNWLREATKWLPMVRRIEVLSGRKPLPVDSDIEIVIINYDILDAWQSPLIAWEPKALILDESHYCKSLKTKRTKAAKAIAACSTVTLRLLLSGTPILNAPHELIAQLNILGRMNDLGGYRTFTSRYCIRNKQWGGFERGGRNLEELNAKMRSGGMFVRRLKKDVLAELPTKQRSLVSIELNNRRRYEAAQKRVARKIAAGRVERATARREGREPEGWALAASVTGITDLRKVAAECKLSASLDWIRDKLEAGEKLVIFAHHIAVVERVAAELNCPMIRGGGKTHRQAAVDQFQNDDDTRAIVLNLQAGGVGFTLTAASNVVFVEIGLTPAANDQAEDRCHRMGQRDSVTAWYLLADNTIDQWLYDLVARKRETVDATTDGDADVQKSIVSELAEMLVTLAA